MTSTIQPSYTDKQIAVWLHGLLSIAWADGQFDLEEQQLIAELTQQDVPIPSPLTALQPLASVELAASLGTDPTAAENFLRMAVMVALIDGIYSDSENELLCQYCEALGLKTEILQALRSLAGAFNNRETFVHPAQLSLQPQHPLNRVRDWLDKLEIHDPKLARLLCRAIPAQCPFERDITVFGRKVAHIPPLCKLNPLYEQLVGLRFRALSYLADQCHEDVSQYC